VSKNPAASPPPPPAATQSASSAAGRLPGPERGALTSALWWRWSAPSELWREVATAPNYVTLLSLISAVQSEEAAQHAPLVALERDLGLPETTPAYDRPWDLPKRDA